MQRKCHSLIKNDFSEFVPKFDYEATFILKYMLLIETNMRDGVMQN